MKTIIAGSRGFYDYQLLATSLTNCPWEISEVVSGCARGADTLGERWAFEAHKPIRRFPANWDRDGNRAGYIRNKVMSQYAEALVAFWDGHSRGTRDMIETMKAQGRSVVVIRVPVR